MGILTVSCTARNIARGYHEKPAYYFTIGGAIQKVTEPCAQYSSLLDRMIADFKAADPSPHPLTFLHHPQTLPPDSTFAPGKPSAL